MATDLAGKDQRAFKSVKWLLRKPVAVAAKLRENESIEEFVDIWYAESTRAQLKHIRIRD